jgi:hypothetical protein
VIATPTDTLFIPCELVVPAPFAEQDSRAREGYVALGRRWRSLSVADGDIRQSEFDPFDPPIYDESIINRAGLGPEQDFDDPQHRRTIQQLVVILGTLGVDWI